MITLKLPITLNNETDIELIKQYQIQYSNCLHFMYNRVIDGYSETEIKHLNINNIDLLDSWFKQSCVKEAVQLVKTNKNKKLIFGGRKNFYNRLKNIISKEEFKENRLSCIYSIGESKNPSVKSNRKFFIKDISTVIFKPNRNTKIELNLPKNLSKTYKEKIKKLIELQEFKNTSITYKLSTKFIYISFDEELFKEKQIKFINNRIISIDLNPNFIGWSIIDWKNSEQFNIIETGTLTLKHLNDMYNSLKTSSNDSTKKYINNKRNYEIYQSVQFLINKAVHYKCKIFALEDLNIKNTNHDKGKNFNRLINNQWNRVKLLNNLNKWCTIYGINLIKVLPQYSSFVGNIVFRNLNLPDMVLSSIELSRRAFEFYHQYQIKDVAIKKNIVWIELTDQVKKQITESLEELGFVFDWLTLNELYSKIKNSKIKYRVPLVFPESFSRKSLKFYNIL